MKKHSNKQFDKIVAKAFKDLPLESPSDDFTFKVMESVKKMPVPELSGYKPLISKPIWIALASLVVASIAIGYKLQLGSISWLDNLNIGRENTVNGFEWNIPSLEWSNPLVYATLIMGLLIVIQLRMLKPMIDNNNLA